VFSTSLSVANSTNLPAGTRLLLRWYATAIANSPTWNFVIGGNYDSHISVNVANQGGTYIGTFIGDGSGLTNLNTGMWYTNSAAAGSISNNYAVKSLSYSADTATITTLTATTVNGNGAGLTNLSATNIVADGQLPRLIATGFDATTNLWAINTAFPLGTNTSITSGADTGGITGVANSSTATERYGQITLKTSGDVTFTNPAAFYTSDFVDSRVITNGNTAVIAVQLIPGLATNMAIAQFK
jgi:hypothetical protein